MKKLLKYKKLSILLLLCLLILGAGYQAFIKGDYSHGCFNLLLIIIIKSDISNDQIL